MRPEQSGRNRDAGPDPALKQALDGLYQEIAHDYLTMDPLEMVRRYPDPRDQETAGFIASCLALGQAGLIRKFVEAVLTVMGESPHRFARNYDPRNGSNPFAGLTYRFYKERDIGLLVHWTGQMLRAGGSIEAFFLRGYRYDELHVGPALSRFVRSIHDLETEPFYSKPLPSVGARHFLTDPASGSGCKRMNLFLRWMVRRDGLDLGLWKNVSPSQLIIPLDTHIQRLSRCLALTSRRAPGWPMALEITDSLRRLDPGDPVKYDFSLCTLGKLRACPDDPGPVICSGCPVMPFCRRCETRSRRTSHSAVR